MQVPPARILRWTPRYAAPGQPDLFYVNEVLGAFWANPDGTVPRLGNPEDPLDDLVYLILTRRGRIQNAQEVFAQIRTSISQDGRPDWSRFADQGVEAMAGSLHRLGMARVRARELHRALHQIREAFGATTLDPLRGWQRDQCLAFLCSLAGVSLKTAACVMLYTLGKDVFPADVHCARILARLGVLPNRFERQEHHRAAQRLLLDGRIPKGMAYRLHVSLVLHGQAICTASRPKCGQCPVRGFCRRYRTEATARWQHNAASPSCVDLFSGAGGTSIGLSRPVEWGHDPAAQTTPTIRVALAAELDTWAHKTYATNHPEVPVRRVLAVDLTTPRSKKKIILALRREPNLLVVIGGPPCQKVSLIGTTGRRMAVSKYGRFDRRHGAKTYIAFRDIVRSLKTPFFIMENVPGLLAANGGTAEKDILEDFAGLYAARTIRVEAADHGVPQRRRRVLIIGVAHKPDPAVAADALAFLAIELLRPLPHATWQHTFGAAVSDLPALTPGSGREFQRHPGGQAGHRTPYQRALQNGSAMIFNHVARPNNVRDTKLYELLQPGEVGADAHYKYDRPDLMIYRNDIFHDKYRRQVWDAPSTTIVAHLAKDGHMFIHPQQVRSITVREAARLQSFPDDFLFLGPRTEQFRQVGNAVPPLLGARIRAAILRTAAAFFPARVGH